MTDPARRALLWRLLGTAAVMTCGQSRAVNETSADEILVQVHALLRALHSVQLKPFMREWPAGSERRVVEPTTVPAVRWLSQIQRSAPIFSAALVDALAEAAPMLAWRRSYSAEAAGADFYENYGWTEFAGLAGPVPSRHLACGALLLGPHVSYPPHHHEADEIYVPLVGTSRWKHGRSPWRAESPGSVIHHARHESHAMQTESEPLLALYLWRSRDLAQSSLLDVRSP